MRVNGIVGIHVIKVVYRFSRIQIRRCVPLCRVFRTGSIRVVIYRDAVYFADEFTPDISHIVEKFGEPLFHIMSWLRSVYIKECSYRAQMRRKGIKMPGWRHFPSVTWCQSLACITIHARKTHQGDSGAFSGRKTGSFAASAAKPRTARLSGARNETLW